jgi:hypothetical protein
MGIPVAAMVVIAALASLFILARAAVKSEGRSRRSLAAITGIAVLSYLHSMIDFSLQIPGYLVLFGVLLGCGLARASAKSAEVAVRPFALLELLSDQKPGSEDDVRSRKRGEETKPQAFAFSVSPASTEPTIDSPDEAFARLVTRTGQLRAP